MKKYSSNIRKLLILAALALGFAVACRKEANNAPGPGKDITITPTSGLAGTVATITGSGFDTVISHDMVTFNGKQAMIQSVTPTTMQVTVPDTTSGPVSVSVDGKTVTGPQYTFQTLSIASVSPAQGPAGTSDTINGAGFVYNSSAQGYEPSVTFNGRLATVTSVSASRLIVIVPDSAGNGPVVVTLGTVKATYPNFYFLGIDSIGPLTGNAGTKVTIKGGFGADLTKVKVTINGNQATINSISAGQIVVTVPAGSGSGPVDAIVNGQTVPGSIFTYVPPPTISGILPSSGPAGTAVTITGTVFSSIPAQDIVVFNGIATTASQAGPTTLTTTVPAGASTGPVSVNVNGQVATGPVFTVQSLGIISVSPPSGPPGTVVTITGTGFNPAASQNHVSFNGTAATVTSATATQLVVTVPQGFTPGPITVTTGGLTATGPVFKNKTPGVTTIAGGTLNPGQFSSPTGLAIDAAGNVYVADNGLNNIQKIAPDGNVTTFENNLSGPTDLVFDHHGNLYVADQTMVRVITPAGAVSTFATNPNGDAFYGVAVDAMGNIYASDNSLGANGAVYEFSPGGTLINTIGVNYNAGGCCRTQLDGLTVDGTGDVYIIDGWGYGLLESVNSGGSFQPAQTVSSSDAGNFSNRTGPDMGICLDNSGNVIVADGGWNEIDLVSPQTFANIAVYGGGGNGNTNAGYQDGPLATALFNRPTGVKVDTQGAIYVADQGNAAIRKIVLP